MEGLQVILEDYGLGAVAVALSAFIWHKLTRLADRLDCLDGIDERVRNIERELPRNGTPLADKVVAIQTQLDQVTRTGCLSDGKCC